MRGYKFKAKHRGENHHKSKLTEEQVAYIRANYVPNSHQKGFSSFARKFNLAPDTIASAYYGRTWINVDEPPQDEEEKSSDQ
jgi:hypothetical protein